MICYLVGISTQDAFGIVSEYIHSMTVVSGCYLLLILLQAQQKLSVDSIPTEVLVASLVCSRQFLLLHASFRRLS